MLAVYHKIFAAHANLLLQNSADDPPSHKAAVRRAAGPQHVGRKRVYRALSLA